MFLKFIFIILCFSKVEAIEILFSRSDSQIEIKKSMIRDIKEIMGENNIFKAIESSKKSILWLDSSSLHSFGDEEQPRFIPADGGSSLAVLEEIKKECLCEIEEAGGIVVASPFIAATMYYRKGWAGHSQSDIEGKAPPIVIAYHEFAHVKDFLSDKESFNSAAGQLHKRWKNYAEWSAVEQQNDFVITLAYKKKIFYSRRNSYGHNDYYKVNGPYEIH